MAQNFPDNALYQMDNLDVLRGMNSETVDLIATDPPFNTKRNRAGSAGFYVDNWKWGNTGILPDQWRWNEVHPKWLEEIKDGHMELYHAIDAAKHCQGEDTTAFLCFLSVRLLEMHRVLKPTGSIYLHCDPTASHYIKMCMDAIWGKKNFRNEVVWRYKSGGATTRYFAKKHDVILFYSKKSNYKFNAIKEKSYQGVGYNTGNKNVRLYEDEHANTLGPHTLVNLKDWWQIKMLATSSNERTGSPDQKPLELYERIVKAASNEGDLVLDPFCGCATTIIAANNLNRRWVGIDRRVDARYHIITRLMGATRKERQYFEKFATDKEWLDQQMRQFEMHYQTEPPTRDDDAADAPPELEQVYHVRPEKLHTHAEMHEILVNQFGLKCWGCNFEPPDKRYLHLDHIIPKSDGGTNHIDNRALLCQPCNSKKSNAMSLSALRRANKREGYMQDGDPVNLMSALYWTRERLIEKVRETPRQYSY